MAAGTCQSYLREILTRTEDLQTFVDDVGSRIQRTLAEPPIGAATHEPQKTHPTLPDIALPTTPSAE